MTKASGGGSAEVANAADTNIIELELTREDALALSRAAERQQAGAVLSTSRPRPSPAPRPNETLPLDLAASSGGWHLVIATVVLAIAVTLALGRAAHRAAQSLTPVPTAAIKIPTSHARAPTLPAESQQPVRVRNPFDTSEEFEFPPGTSATEAREWVAELLLQRARDRLMAGRVKSQPVTRGTPDKSADLARNSTPRRGG